MTNDEKKAVAAFFTFLVIVILLLVSGPGIASIFLEILSFLP